MQNFEDLIFVGDKLPAKTVKITSLKNLYLYSIHVYVTFRLLFIEDTNIFPKPGVREVLLNIILFIMLLLFRPSR